MCYTSFGHDIDWPMQQMHVSLSHTNAHKHTHKSSIGLQLSFAIRRFTPAIVSYGGKFEFRHLGLAIRGPWRANLQDNGATGGTQALRWLHGTGVPVEGNSLSHGTIIIMSPIDVEKSNWSNLLELCSKKIDRVGNCFIFLVIGKNIFPNMLVKNV